MLAKNEIEGCQLIFATEVAKSELSVSITNFVNANGDEMTAEILQGYYFEIDGEMIIDPLPPAGVGNFATKDADENEIKKVTVFAYVWDFTLADESSSKVLMDLDYNNIYTMAGRYYVTDLPLYENYYNYLLENRICAYTLPGIAHYGNWDSSNPDHIGKYTSSVMAYLNNPRVVAFLNLGWKNTLTEEKLQNAYNSLTNEDGSAKVDANGNSLLDKAYFYTVDEPNTKDKLDEIIATAELIKENYSTSYKLIAPMHVTSHLVNEEGKIVDFFEYVSDAVTAWCPKTFFYTTFAEYASNEKATQGTSIYSETTFGLFKERMASQMAGGDETWWYVTRRPNDPEITLNTDRDAVEYRILFWQQKLYNVDNFLYYSCNDWVAGSDNAGIDNKAELDKERVNTNGWYSKHEIGNATGVDIYGGGVLIYHGMNVYQGSTNNEDYAYPVGSLKLECVRDGIEDYEYFTMLEEYIGKDNVDLIINKITTSLICYKSDAELMAELHEEIGSLLESYVKSASNQD